MLSIWANSTCLSIDPINYARGDELIQNLHRMKSGAAFRYVWGKQARAKFNAMVDSSTAAIVNSWWSINQPVYAVQSDGTADVGTCYITNKQAPFASFRSGNNTLWMGAIELEGF